MPEVDETGGRTTSSTRRPLDLAVQGRVEDYLRRVDVALAAKGAAPADRRDAAIALRNQFNRALSDRCGDRAATPAGAEAAIASLPTPEHATVPPRPRGAPAAHVTVAPEHRFFVPREDATLSLTALAGAIWALLFFLMIIVGSIPLDIDVEAGEAPPAWYRVASVILQPLGWSAPLATTVLGLLAIGRIHASRGRLYGLSLAVFDALLFPLLLLDVGIFWLFWRIADVAANDLNMPPAAAAVVFRQALPTIVCVLGDYYLATRAWAAARKPPAAGARGEERW